MSAPAERDQPKITDPGDREKGSSQRRVGFLSLPPEIRLIIYRLLLRHSKPLAGERYIKLSPAILRTCRLILEEARPVLYGENIWKMRIFHCNYEVKAYFLDCISFDEEAVPRWGPRLADMRNFYVVVGIDGRENMLGVRSPIAQISKTLSHIPVLNYVHIKLCFLENLEDWDNFDEWGYREENNKYDEDEEYDTQKFCQVLQNFTLLRHVRKVKLEGVPPKYAEYLASKMRGPAPLDHLPNMFDALNLFAGQFDFCIDLLQSAWDAVEDSNVKLFKGIREEIMQLVDQYMTDARNRLFDHDADLKEEPKSTAE